MHICWCLVSSCHAKLVVQAVLHLPLGLHVVRAMLLALHRRRFTPFQETVQVPPSWCITK